MKDKQTIRLSSSEMIYTPGIIAWAKQGYLFPSVKDRKYFVNLLVTGFGLTASVSRGLLTGKIPYIVEGEGIVFKI